jgi:predicted XRE-type DNA-binding protein
METLVVALEYSNIFEAITADTAESTELQSRSDLILAIRDVVHAKKWDLKQAAAICITQVTVTDLVNGRIDKLSINKLTTYYQAIVTQNT